MPTHRIHAFLTDHNINSLLTIYRSSVTSPSGELLLQFGEWFFLMFGSTFTVLPNHDCTAYLTISQIGLIDLMTDKNLEKIHDQPFD